MLSRNSTKGFPTDVFDSPHKMNRVQYVNSFNPFTLISTFSKTLRFLSFQRKTLRLTPNVSSYDSFLPCYNKLYNPVYLFY